MRRNRKSIQDSGFGIQGSRGFPLSAFRFRPTTHHSPLTTHSPAAFTLIEILVVITILLVLTALVVTVFNINAGADKLRSSARIAQSAILGARDRALHAGERRGLRFLRDPQDNNLVTGFAYTQPIENLQYGRAYGPIKLRIEYTNTNEPRIVRGTSGNSPSASDDIDWDFLDQNYLLSYPRRIRIPAATGQWYTFQNVQAVPMSNPKEVTLVLTTDFVSPDNAAPGSPPPVAVPDTSSNASCDIEVGFELLPNSAPFSLPSGVVIDLKYSGRGDFGRGGQSLAQELSVSPQATLELLFSPRGNVTGPVSARGPIYLLLNDIQDATQNLNPTDPANKGEKLVLAIFPQTGNVGTFPIDPDPTDADGDTRPDNLFRYAKLGSTAGQ